MRPLSSAPASGWTRQMQTLRARSCNWFSATTACACTLASLPYSLQSSYPACMHKGMHVSGMQTHADSHEGFCMHALA